ncbi:MAG: hypothetical protein LBP69_09970 [Treponema sp.]|jgi:hypothetical protein|nr:hypothetical protein [Treponema sp.]
MNNFRNGVPFRLFPAILCLCVASGFAACGPASDRNTPAVPDAEYIGNCAFVATGAQALTVVLPRTAPSVGINLFRDTGAKTVVVKVPPGATGYGTVPGTYAADTGSGNWGDGFRGGGWDSMVTAASMPPDFFENYWNKRYEYGSIIKIHIGSDFMDKIKNVLKSSKPHIKRNVMRNTKFVGEI